MKPDTITKRLKDVVEKGVIPFSTTIEAEGNDENITRCLEAVEHLIEARRLLAEVESNRTPAKGPKRPGRRNNQSIRVWRRDKFTCMVCGSSDPSCDSLSSAKLIQDAKKDEDFITLCKTHMKEFKEIKPWRTRSDKEETLNILLTMSKPYTNGDTSEKNNGDTV